MSAANNPGGAMAAEIDAEIAIFRGLQEQLNRVRGDLQLVLSQQAENEMVLQELELLDSTNNHVYKMVGPVLIRNSLEDAQDTVKKRLEFIVAERKRLEEKGNELEQRGNEISIKVQQLQANLQRATAAAVNAIAASAAAGGN
jgi:prefoldin beta subunit